MTSNRRTKEIYFYKTMLLFLDYDKKENYDTAGPKKRLKSVQIFLTHH